jgi:Na+-transporting NADH:ubiquinone oxidoreductase subunit F
MMQIVLTMVTLTTIVVVLVGIVLLARRLLVASGNVSILINDSRNLLVPAGDKLLWTLAGQGVYLPAACGGRGSCGQCRLVIERGGGEPLLTEMAHISHRDLKQHWRLACMVTVREDLAINLPEAIFKARQWACRVRSNLNVSTYQTELVLDLDAADELDFEPGSYMLLAAPPGETRFADFDIEEEYRQEWQRNHLFDLVAERDESAMRAYSIANHPLEQGVVMFLVRIALPPPDAPDGTPPGKVSSYAFGLKPGDTVTISGPFGSFRARDSTREMVFIGGGAGMAPMRSMIFDQLLHKKSGRKITFFYGARSLRDICYQSDFDELAARFDNFDWYVALSEPQADSEWAAQTGFIHTVVYDAFLEKHPHPEQAEYYVCGPPVMSNAVLGMLEDLGVDRNNVFFDDFGN